MQFSDTEKIYNKLFPENEMYAFRNDLHMHPEIGGEEFRTVEKICEKLDEYGLQYEHVADTGLVVRIPGNRPGKTIGIRADIDALPIEEESDFAYKSQVPLRCHACGHDIHCSILLGVAKILASLKGDFAGNFTLLFQPAEESFGGAERMIAAGVLENPHVDHVIGLHNDPNIPAGQVAVKHGGAYAGCYAFRMVIHGSSAHAARPHEGVDPVVCASQIVLACQTIVSRNISPVEPAVVTFGIIQGGTVQNQIPESVVLRGTTRTLSKENREKVIRRVEKIAQGICDSMGATLEFEGLPSYLPLINDDRAVDCVKAIMEEAIGKEKVHVLAEPRMGSEDFAYFAAERPSVFYQLGSGRADGSPSYGLHSAKFNPDAERAIPFGIKLQATIALSLAGN